MQFKERFKKAGLQQQINTPLLSRSGTFRVISRGVISHIKFHILCEGRYSLGCHSMTI